VLINWKFYKSEACNLMKPFASRNACSFLSSCTYKPSKDFDPANQGK